MIRRVASSPLHSAGEEEAQDVKVKLLSRAVRGLAHSARTLTAFAQKPPRSSCLLLESPDRTKINAGNALTGRRRKQRKCVGREGSW